MPSLANALFVEQRILIQGEDIGMETRGQLRALGEEDKRSRPHKENKDTVAPH
jgi:hypothetical protein